MNIVLWVKSLFDDKGVQQAVQGIERTEGAAKKSATATQGAAAGMQAVSAASAAAQGNVQGVAGAMNGLAASFPKVAGAAGTIGIAAVAVKGLQEALGGVIDTMDKSDKLLQSTAAGNAAARIQSLARAYEMLSGAVEDAAKELDRQLDLEREAAAAEQALAEAKLESEKQSALSKAAPGAAGDSDRRRIELDFQARAAAMQAQFAKGTVQAEVGGMRAQAAGQRTAAAEAADMAAGVAEALQREMDRFEQARSEKAKLETASPESVARFIGGRRQSTLDRYQGEMDDSLRNQEALLAKEKALRKKSEDATAEAAALEAKAGFKQRGAGAIDINAEAQRTATDTARRDMDADAASKAREADRRRRETERKALLDAVRAEAEPELPLLRKQADRADAEFERTRGVAGRTGLRRDREAAAGAAQRSGNASAELMRVEALLKQAEQDDAALAALLERYINARARANAAVVNAAKRDAA